MTDAAIKMVTDEIKLKSEGDDFSSDFKVVTEMSTPIKNQLNFNKKPKYSYVDKKNLSEKFEHIRHLQKHR